MTGFPTLESKTASFQSFYRLSSLAFSTFWVFWIFSLSLCQPFCQPFCRPPVLKTSHKNERLRRASQGLPAWLFDWCPSAALAEPAWLALPEPMHLLPSRRQASA